MTFFFHVTFGARPGQRANCYATEQGDLLNKKMHDGENMGLNEIKRNTANFLDTQVGYIYDQRVVTITWTRKVYTDSTERKYETNNQKYALIIKSSCCIKKIKYS